MKDFQTELERLRHITDGLGMGIEDGVIHECAYLNCLEMYTRQSCEGHADPDSNHGVPYPWIDFSSNNNPVLSADFNEWNKRRAAIQLQVFIETALEFGLTVKSLNDKQLDSLDSDTAQKLYELFDDRRMQRRSEIRGARLMDAVQKCEIDFPQELQYEELHSWLYSNLPIAQFREILNTARALQYPEDGEYNPLNEPYYERVVDQKADQLNKTELIPKIEKLMSSYTPQDSVYGYVFSDMCLMPKVIADNKVAIRKFWDDFMPEDDGIIPDVPQQFKLLENLSQKEKEEFLSRSRKAFAHFSEYLKEYYFSNN